MFSQKYIRLRELLKKLITLYKAETIHDAVGSEFVFFCKHYGNKFKVKNLGS